MVRWVRRVSLAATSQLVDVILCSARVRLRVCVWRFEKKALAKQVGAQTVRLRAESRGDAKPDLTKKGLPIDHIATHLLYRRRRGARVM